MSFFAKNDIVDVDIPGMNKKTILWTISFIVLGIATSYATLYYLQWRDEKAWEKLKESKSAEIQQELIEEEKLIAEQMEELNKQRQEAGIQPLSEEEIKKQTEELETLRKEADMQPPTEEQIQKQKEELDNIKQQLK